MKGRTRTAAEKRFHDLLCQQIGCIACLIDSGRTRRNNWCSAHHIEGRTKPGAHLKVIPLCGPHHQDQGIDGVIAVHPWKRRFEDKYGNQLNLLSDCIQQLVDAGHELPDDVLAYI